MNTRQKYWLYGTLIVILLLAMEYFVFWTYFLKPTPVNNCLELEGCEQFHCLLPECWCAPTGPPGSEIIYDSNLTVTDTDSAKAVVDKYFQSHMDKAQDFHHITDLGLNWYNIFYGKHEDIVYTVGPDGNIYKTECGV